MCGEAREGWKPVTGRVPPTSSPGRESTAGLQDEAGSVGRPEVAVAWPWWQWCGVAADEVTQHCGGLRQGHREREATV